VEIKIVLTIAVFVIVYIVIAFDLVNKSTMALLGASFLVMVHVIPVDTAITKIDFKVIALLVSMMIIVNVIKETGIFHYLAIKAVKIARGDPLKILLLIMVITAFVSAFLDNVTTVLIMSPLSIVIATELGISPLPYLIMQAIISNIGGTATLIGDPPNIMIGYGASLTFNDFLINMSLLVLIITGISLVVTIFLFKNSLRTTPDRRKKVMGFNESEAINDKVFTIKSMVILFFIIVGFITNTLIGIDPSVIALFGSSLLLLMSHHLHQDKYFGEVEWTTIFFFIGLYVMVGAMEEVKIIDFLGKKMIHLAGDNISVTAMAILWGSGVLSGFIDNIPFTATMIPLLKVVITSYGTASGSFLWWVLSAGACLGGNLTLVGASANIVVSGIAAKNGYPISFFEFTKYGIIYTLISLGISSVFFYFRYLI
jgi:Na+/H+ antiporter NhaD/arsenite permease-like protein